MSITREDLKRAGFTCHPATHKKWALCLWQKRIDDPDEEATEPVRYFVNVYEYPPRPEYNLSEKQWSVDVRLYFPGDDDQQGDLTYFVRPSTTLGEILAFYAHAYTALGCVPDRHNQP